MAQSVSARQQGSGGKVPAAPCFTAAAPDTAALSDDDEAWRYRRESPCLWRLPFLAGVAALYLSYAGWAGDDRPSPINFAVTLTAEVLDPLLIWDRLWVSPEI